MAPSTEIFNRNRVHTYPQTEHAPYQLAKLTTEQFWNFCKSKMVTLYAAVYALPKEPGKRKQMRLRGTDTADFDVAWIFTDGNEREIWAAFYMPEDLPSSCLY